MSCDSHTAHLQRLRGGHPGWDIEPEMAEVLRGLKGAFVLSINDRPEVRDLFAGFAMEAVEASYSLAREKRRRFGELIITSGRPDATR